MPRDQIDIIVSTGGGRTYRVRVPRATAILASIAVVVAVLGIITVLVSYGKVAAVASRVRSVDRENEILRYQNARVLDLKNEVDRLRTLEAKMLAIMGIDTLAAARLRFEAAWPEVGSSTYSTQRAEEFIWPVRGSISRGYQPGEEGKPPHMGLDITGQAGTPVRAALRGTVSFAGEDSVYGKLLILDHGAGLTTLYGHNSKLLVKKGDLVEGGQVIARLGSTGRSSAPHLHFEVREGDNAVDPHKYLKKEQ